MPINEQYNKQPVRAHHCRVCGLCVSRFDHHCSCLGVCVGERNHCRFWWFILAQNAACLAAIDVVRTPGGVDMYIHPQLAGRSC